MNRRLEKLKKYIPFNLIFPIALLTLVWLLATLYHSIPPAPTEPFTFQKCTQLYGLGDSTSPKCKTPDGRIYIEFKIKGETFEECIEAGGRITDSGCISKDGMLVPRLPKDVSSYNECRNSYPRHIFNTTTEPYICVDKNGLAYYAGGIDRKVNSYEECLEAGGPVSATGIPRKCYFDTVIYWQTLKPSHKYLNLPEELRSFEDCVVPGTAVEIKAQGDKIWCKAFNDKIYYYSGPKIDSFEDCARVMGFVLESNPPQCYVPDGNHYIGPRS